MRSPIVAMLWENWRLTRVEAAWRLALGVVGGLSAFVVFAATAPNEYGPGMILGDWAFDGEIPTAEAAKDAGATVALTLIIFVTFPLWVSIARLKGGRFLDGYRPGFPLSLLYTRPVRTAVLVGVPMAYQAALAAAVYLVSALVLGWTFDYPFPLLSVAVPIAAVHLAQSAGDWSTRSKVVQWLGQAGPVLALGSLAMFRWVGWPALFDFSPVDYALMTAIGLASFGVAIAGVARQRRGDAPAGMPWAAGSAGFPEWLVNLFRFPCPTSSATRAQVWFDLKSSGLPVLTIGLALAMVTPPLFALSVPVEWLRPVAVVCGMFSVLTVLALAGNAFGIRRRHGRTYASAFEATQAYDTAGLAGLKVLVRSVCVLAAFIAVGVSVWVSLSFIAVGEGYEPLRSSQRAIEGAVGGLTGYQQAALAIVTSLGVAALAVVTPIGIVVMVAMRAALTALQARYPRRVNVAGSLLLLYVLAFVLRAPAGHGGNGWEVLFMDALFRTTPWTAAAAIVLATAYLFWRSFTERLLTLGQACVALLVSAAFGAAWVTLLRAAGVPLAAMPATDAVWMLSPALLPLMTSVLAPWSLSRIRHT